MRTRAQRWIPRSGLSIVILAIAALFWPGLASAAPPPPDLVAPVAGEVRIRVKRGSAGADHRIYLLVDRGGDGRWDETHSLPRLVGENSSHDTGVDVEPDDELDLRLDVSFNNYSNRILYTRDRRRRAGEPDPRVIAPTGRRCGGGSGSPALDISNLLTTSAELIACSCWEDYTDWDFNDFALCVDYTPESLPTPTPTLSVTATITPTVTLSPTPTSTPSPSPEHSATPSPTPTATSSSTPRPSPTASPEPRPLYLPLLLHQRCIKERQPADVVLLLDLSTSMLQPAPEGDRKLDAALEAARGFLAQMRLDDHLDRQAIDRIAIVGFNDGLAHVTGLTDDRVQLDAAIAALPAAVAEGTRLDLALDRAGVLLATREASAFRNAAVVLLTDGQPNRVPTPEGGGGQEDTVLSAADRVKQLGVRIFAVGLGQDRDLPRWLLEHVASRPGDHHRTPNASELKAIYEAIAIEVQRCP